MRTQISCFVALAGMLAIGACSDTASSPPANPFPGTGGTAGSGPSTTTGATAGSSTTTSPTTSGTGGSNTGGTAGATGGSSGGGAAGTGGTGGTGGTTGGTAGSPDAGGGGSSGAGGGTGGEITTVAPTAGCGQPAPPNGRGTIATMGTKPAGCADSRCGAWSYDREYFINLPANYNNMKPYPLVFLGPGCGSNGTAIYPLNNNAGGTVIRIGLTPPPNTIGHATNPNQGCFDDKEGDDSVDWVFYENLWDKLAGQLCFDKNRVFAGGNSSGAWFGNEVGCKYAGDAKHPIRGIMPNTGGLPTDPKFVPTCTTAPMSGIWMGETQDPENPFAGNVVAINRAIRVNKCMGGDWGTTPTMNWTVGTDNTCKMITGCPQLYPLIVCLITGNQHAGHDNLANPAFAQYLQLFQKAPFLTP